MKTTRFVYLTDTHLGCDATGYYLQPRYLNQHRVLFEGLAQWIKQYDIDFLVHGGDLTDHGTDEEINHATELCSLLGAPVYLCLGNHDLAQPDSMQKWRNSAFWRADGRDGDVGCYAVDIGPATLIVANHHWHADIDDRWLHHEPQTPRFDAQQERAIRLRLQQANKPVIAVTHAPLNAVTIDRSGEIDTFHPPHPPYLTTWQRIATEHSQLRLVFCGHNHANSKHDHGSFVSCSTVAFTEVPAQLRLVTVSTQQIEVRTVALAEIFGLTKDLDADQSWCLGSSEDQHFSVITR